MNNSSNQIDKYNLISLLSLDGDERVERIKIPIIQRDYAQGRDNKRSEKIRTTFLGEIFNHLENNKELMLDFIYGSIEDNCFIPCFIPLDGQQRLTTLFLLYWYFAAVEGKEKEFQEHFVRSSKSRFFYETRFSSSDFCHALVNIKNMNLIQEALTETKEIDGQRNGVVSQVIKSHTWYYAHWNSDPTISGMLTMLDAIHEKYIQQSQHLFDRMQCIIFGFINLRDFHLTNDLYVKMNARGKQLTSFEIFKSEFEQHIEEQKWEGDTDNPTESFAHKIDGEWTDLFWKLVKGEPHQLDEVYMRCITTIAMQSLALQDTKISTKIRQDRIAELRSESDQLRSDDFEKKGYDMLTETLDVYCASNNTLLNFDCTFWDPSLDNIPLFSIFLDQDNLTYQKRALFYAQTQYLIQQKNIDENFYHWMRVARNIVYEAFKAGTPAEQFYGVIGLLHRLLSGLIEKETHNIYDYLANKMPDYNSFLKEKISHEKEKAHILINNSLLSDQNNIIFQLEDTEFCKGNIKFALYCIDYQKGNIDINLDKLQTIKAVFIKWFTKINGEFRRALLTIGDNDFYKYQRYWSTPRAALCYPLIEDRNDLIKFSEEKSKSGTQEYRGYLKELVNQLIEHSPSQIIDAFKRTEKYKALSWWIQALISNEKDCLSNDRRYIIPDKDRDTCFILPGERRGWSKYHINLKNVLSED